MDILIAAGEAMLGTWSDIGALGMIRLPRLDGLVGLLVLYVLEKSCMLLQRSDSGACLLQASVAGTPC